MSVKNSNDTIGNRTRDLPTCSAVPQPTALPRTPKHTRYMNTSLCSCCSLKQPVPGVIILFNMSETSEVVFGLITDE